jgi:hypothetical protein
VVEGSNGGGYAKRCLGVADMKKEAQKFGAYLGMELAKQAGGKPARGEPIWTQGKPATFKDRVGEAVFGKVLWTYLKAKPR